MTGENDNPPVKTGDNAPDKSTIGEANSAHSRINVPLNLDNWKHLDAGVQDELLWFHQLCLERHMSWDEAGEALDYDRSTLFRVLKGTYEGSYKNVVAAIASYKRLVTERGQIQQNLFTETPVSRLIWSGLDYALANESLTTIIGESRMGKSIAVKAWRDANNHGRSVLVTASPYGGTKMLLRDVADAVGCNKDHSIPQLLESVRRAFNRNRILIVDEAHRLLPSGRRWTPVNLEILRDLHDRTGCALALVATQRFDDELRKSHWQFEQLIGRIGCPVRLPRSLRKCDWEPIVRQYIKAPSAQLCDDCAKIANDPGRLGILTETLRLASRIAAKARQPMREEHVFKAIAIRRQMQGQTEFSKN